LFLTDVWARIAPKRCAVRIDVIAHFAQRRCNACESHVSMPVLESIVATSTHAMRTLSLLLHVH